MSEFISDIEAARLIQNLGIESDETSEDGFTKVSTLTNGETLTQHLGPRQWEYSGSLDATLEQVPTTPTAAEQAAPATAEAPLDPAAPVAEPSAAPAAEAPPLEPAAPVADNQPSQTAPVTPAEALDTQTNAEAPLDPAAPAAEPAPAQG